MSLPQCKELLLDLHQGVLSITLNRPHKRNAMNSQLVMEMMAALKSIKDDRSVRIIVLRGKDGNFCAGGDISGMNEVSADQLQGRDASWHFNRSFGHLISQLNKAPQIVIALLEGAVLGGGFGLACVSDVAIADKNAMFAMPETGLGIVPAQIGPFVVARIGITQARRLALLGERVNGTLAQQLGLVHHVVDGEAPLLEKLNEVCDMAMRCAPQATAISKQLLLDVSETLVVESILDHAADEFTKAMLSDEGQEGTRAFVDKRKPKWAKKL